MSSEDEEMASKSKRYRWVCDEGTCMKQKYISM